METKPSNAESGGTCNTAPDTKKLEYKPDAPTPDDLRFRKDGVQLGEATYYRSLFFLDTLGATKGGLTLLAGPIDPFASNLSDAPLPPAVGVLTMHEQMWVQGLLQRGNVRQSLCLAPGEVVQFASTDWGRIATGQSEASTSQDDYVDSSITQDRLVNETQRAVSRDAQFGGSSASSSSVTNQAGVSGGSLLFGGSSSAATSATSALTAQYSTGVRSLAADSTTALKQSTSEHSHALRSRLQVVVKQVSEKEAETLSTRVLVNYNRRHALNVLLFEILQTYKVTTTLKYWDRCLFIPLTPLSFISDDKNAPNKKIIQYGAQLMSIFADLGRTDLVERIDRILKNQGAETFSDAEKEPRYIQLNNWLECCETILDKLEGGPTPEGKKEVIKQIGKLLTLGARFHELAPSHQPSLGRVVGWVGSIRRAIDDYIKTRGATYHSQFAELLEQNRLFISQQLWIRMGPDQVMRMLQEYQVNGTPLVSSVDPHPIGVFGNYLAFRWRFSKDEAGKTERKQFAKDHLGLEDPDTSLPSEIMDVGLPSAGLFAEAILGEGLAAEETNDLYPSWSAKENRIPILPPKIADLASVGRARDLTLTAAELGESLAELRSETVPDVSNIGKVLEQVTKGDAFRNMGGLDATMKLANKVATTSATGAKDAANKALEVQKSVQETFIKLLDSEEGKALVAEYMVPGAGAALLTGKDKTETKPSKVESKEVEVEK